MKSKILSAAKILFFLGLGIALIFLFVNKLSEEDKDKIINAVLNADYSWILASMIFGTLAHISRAMRWKQLLEPLDYKPKLSNTFFAVMIMYFANLAVPRLGEVSRCAILKRYEGIPVEKSFGTVVAERAIDLIFLALIFLLTLIFQWDLFMETLEVVKNLGTNTPGENQEKSIVLPLLAIIAAIAGGVLFLFRKNARIKLIYGKILNLILGFVSGLKSAIKVKNPLLFIGHSIFIWLMYILMVYICFFSLPATAELPFHVCMMLLIFGSLGIIIVPGGIGIYPAIISAVLGLYAIDEPTGYAFGWIVWIGQTVLLIVWGLISFTLLPIVNKRSKNVASSAAQ